MGILHPKESIDALKSPAAKELYKALHDEWGLRGMDIGEFCNLLVGDMQMREFYLKRENSRTYDALRKEYSIVEKRNADPVEPPSLGSLNFKAREMIESAEVLLSPNVPEFLKRYYERGFTPGADGAMHTTPFDLSGVVEQHPGMFENISAYMEVAQLLEHRYGMAAKNVFEDLDNHISVEQKLKKLQSPQLQEAFSSLNYEFLKKADILHYRSEIVDSFKSESRLSLARMIEGNEGVEETVQRVVQLGFEPKSAYALCYLIQECHQNRAVREALADPRFYRVVATAR